jgi:hypothetical protein
LIYKFDLTKLLKNDISQWIKRNLNMSEKNANIINKNGICAVKKTKQKEWTDRLQALKNQIEYWCKEDNKTDKTIEIIQLFYDNEL